MQRFISLSVLLSLSGCWNLPDDDAGDRAYVTWATTAILGRAPVSAQELNALLILQEELGREALLDTLMQQPEFVDHWDDLLMHQLHVRTNAGGALKESCYTESYVPDSYDWALSEHLRTADWQEPFCVTSDSASDDLTLESGGRTAGSVTLAYTGEVITAGPSRSTSFTSEKATSTSKAVSSTKPTCFEFTMKDVIRASIRADRMDSLLRAHLAPLAAFDTPVNARRTVFDTYFNRHQDCMECHTTTYSTTNGVPRNDDWDRYYPAVTDVDLEFSAFWTEGPDHSEKAPDILDGSLGGDTMQNRFKQLFSQVQGTPDTPGVKPWGFDETCVEEGILQHPLAFGNGDADLFAGWGHQTGRQVRILDFMNAYDDGFRALAEGSPDRMGRAEFEGVGAHPDADLATCDGCHLSGGDADGMLHGYPAPLPLEELTASMSAARIRLTIEAGSPAGQMAGSYAVDDAVDEIVGHLVTKQTDPVDIYTDPTVGMAHLTALAFVDDVAKHLSGQSLTLDHGFPRNADQASVLATLSDVFIEEEWSLRVVIKTIALSELVNRTAPDESVTDPYILPMVVDPWQDTPVVDDADPVTGVASNGQGDLIHRWPVATLLRKRNAALGWSQTTHFDDVELQTDLGTFVQFEKPGFTDYDMASALAWETNHTTDELLVCRSPYGDGEDVIDVLTDTDLELTLAQALKTVKFRLIGDDHLWGDPEDGIAGLESNRIAEIWDVDPSDFASDHEDVVRDYCAVLLASPQFLFAGVPSVRQLESWVDPEIPCMDEECSEVGWCQRYVYSAVELGYEGWSCYEAGGDIFQWAP